MKKILLIFVIFSLTSQAFPQESFIEQSLVVNVEVPVRVFEGNSFIDNLTIKDFEVFENGIKQKIEAVYLIKKKTIERSEEKKRFIPETSRSFYLFFEVSEYSRRLQDALDYFIENVFLKGDRLIIITPLKTYRLKRDSLAAKPKVEILNELKEIIRRDALQGNSEYRTTLREITELARLITADVQKKMGIQVSSDDDDMDPGVHIATYAGLMTLLQTHRKANEMKLLDLADYLKAQSGQNYVFMFYERKFIPQLDPRLLQQYINYFEDTSYIQLTLMDILDYNKRESLIDFKRVGNSFADTSTSIHFLHITRPKPNIPGVFIEEHSEDTYNVLREIANATGGYTESSSNPDYLFKHALNASENYYMIYYSPKDPQGDGQFKKIKVTLKNYKYRVMHRAGYFDY